MIPGDDCPPDCVRYATARAVEHLIAVLGFPRDPLMQDHEVELADGTRVREFLDTYSDPRLDDDDRFLLMGIIVASLDDLVSQGDDISPFWSRTEALLRTHGTLHASTLSYWARGDDPDPEHQFAMTPAMRLVWRDVRRSLGGQ